MQTWSSSDGWAHLVRAALGPAIGVLLLSAAGGCSSDKPAKTSCVGSAAECGSACSTSHPCPAGLYCGLDQRCAKECDDAHACPNRGVCSSDGRCRAASGAFGASGAATGTAAGRGGG